MIATVSAFTEPTGPADVVDGFARSHGGQSLFLACHAAVAHRLRPELLALIRTNFMHGAARLQPAHDADVLFGPLCRSQGGGFFVMQAEIREYLVRLLDVDMLHPGRSDYPSRRVARFIRHYFSHAAGTDPRYRTPRFRRFMTENLWRAIALDDPDLARRHIFDHAENRNAYPPDRLKDAPRGGGIVSLVGPVLGILRDEMAYVVAQDMLADGKGEEAIAVFEAIQDADFMIGARALASPRSLAAEQRMFRLRRENTVADRANVLPAPGVTEKAAKENDADASDRGLRIDESKVELRQTELHEAVKRGDLQAVADALERMPHEIDTLGQGGVAPLHLAAEGGHEAIAALLIDRGAVIDRRSAFKSTPLFHSATSGAVGVAGRLLERGAHAARRTAKNNTAVMAAAYYGHAALLDLLLAAPGVDAAVVNSANDEGFIALSGAISLGSRRMFDRLMAAGAVLPDPKEGKWTLLHDAAWSDNVPIAAELVAAGYPVDIPGADGWTPLHVAAQRRSHAVAGLLLECGADPDRPTAFGWTAVHVAANWDAADVLIALHRHGASMTLAASGALKPVLIAAAEGASAALAVLIDVADVDPTERRPDGKDAMALAIEQDDPASARVLLKSRRARPAEPQTCLEAAIRQNKPKVLRLFLERFAPLPAPPAGSQSWIWAACDGKKEDRAEILAALISNPGIPLPDRDGEPVAVAMAHDRLLGALDALISRGVGLDVSDKVGRTPLGVAVEEDHAAAVERLLRAGADPDLPSGWMRIAPLLLAKGEPLLLLLAHGADPLARLPDGRTALHLAAGRKDVPAHVVGGSDAPGQEGAAPAGLHDAAEERALLRAGLAVDVRDLAGQTPLHAAAETGRTGRLGALLVAGATLEARNVEGFTPLLSAVAAGQSETALALLESGADARADLPGGWTALHLAAERGLTALVEALWPCFEDPSAPAAEPARTPLQAAAEAGATATVGRLLELGLRPNAGAAGSPPPLMLAVANGAYEAASILIRAGARLDGLHPATGATMREIAAERKRLHVLSGRFPPEAEELLNRILDEAEPVRPEVPSSQAPLPMPRLLPSRPRGFVLAEPLVSGLRQVAARRQIFPTAGFFLSGLADNPGSRLPASWMQADEALRATLLDAVGRIEGTRLEIAAEASAPQILYCHPPFYQGVRLIRIRAGGWRPRHRALFFLQADQALTRLNGASPPIHEFNARAPVHLDAGNVLSYLRFFCFFVRGEEGPFYLVEDLSDPGLEDLPKRARGALVQTVRPATLESVPDARPFRCSGVVLYSNAVFNADFSVQPDGFVQMTGDTPIASNLPGKLDLPLV